ncbi:MAG: hypothetical protein M5R40_03845 [Anaerolineae bacterium]|nr:hypothetical protein [Anaerolineae bacterium]
MIDELPARLAPEYLPVAPPPMETAPAPPPPREGQPLPEKILGINNLRQIAWIEQGIVAARSVCRVLTPEGPGPASWWAQTC